MSYVWFVVLLFGNLAMTVGPLPYDKAECEARKADKLEEIRAVFKAHGGVLPPAGGVTEEVHPEDVQLLCYVSATRPDVGTHFGGE